MLNGFVCSTGGEEPARQCRRRKRVQSLGREDSLEKEVVSYSIQYFRLENPVDRGARRAIQSTGSQSVGHDRSNIAHMY